MFIILTSQMFYINRCGDDQQHRGTQFIRWSRYCVFPVVPNRRELSTPFCLHLQCEAPLGTSCSLGSWQVDSPVIPAGFLPRLRHLTSPPLSLSVYVLHRGTQTTLHTQNSATWGKLSPGRRCDSTG